MWIRNATEGKSPRFLTWQGKQPSALIKTIRVKEVMSLNIITIAPEASVKEAARTMIEKKVGCLPAVENDELVGLITETDILRYVTES